MLGAVEKDPRGPVSRLMIVRTPERAVCAPSRVPRPRLPAAPPGARGEP